MKVTEEMIDDMIREVDTNKDGEIDYEEFVVVMRKMHTEEK